MADQRQDQQEHPPEKKGTTRRAIVNAHKKIKDVFYPFRRGQTQDEPKGGPVQDHVSCYANLPWEVLRHYLDSKFPGCDFRESKVTLIPVFLWRLGCNLHA